MTKNNYGRFNDPKDVDPKKEKTAEPKSSISHAEKVKSNEPSQTSNPILKEMRIMTKTITIFGTYKTVI